MLASPLHCFYSCGYCQECISSQTCPLPTYWPDSPWHARLLLIIRAQQIVSTCSMTAGTWCAALQKRRAGPSHRKLVMAGSAALGTCTHSTVSVALTISSRLWVSTAAAMLAFPVPESSDTLPSADTSSRPCQATCIQSQSWRDLSLTHDQVKLMLKASHTGTAALLDLSTKAGGCHCAFCRGGQGLKEGKQAGGVAPARQSLQAAERGCATLPGRSHALRHTRCPAAGQLSAPPGRTCQSWRPM